jgi:sarcosine oxidase subunit alpha
MRKARHPGPVGLFKRFGKIAVVDELLSGAHILRRGLVDGGRAGWVTTAVHSPSLGKPIALGLLERGHERLDEEVVVWDLGATRRAQVVDYHFYDPVGHRAGG